MKRTSFDWKRFLKQVAVIAIPVALQNLLTTTGSMVDTVMIATLGEKVVGGVGLSAQFSSLMFACYWGFVGGGMLFISQYWGARDEEGISRSYGMTWTCMMTVAVIFCILGTCLPETVMSMYTDKENIRQHAVPYLRIVAIGYPFTVFSMAAAALLRSTERVRIPLVASIVSVFTNVFLNWVLIFGKLGAPAMGAKGAAIATVIANAVNLLTMFVIAGARRYPFLFRFRAHFRWNGSHLAEYFRKCLPILIGELFIGLSAMIINIILGHQSEEAIAAVAVFRTIEGMFISFFSGFANASSIVVGKAVGAGELETAYQRAKRLVLLCGLAMFAVSAVFQCVATPVLSAMSLSGESLRIGRGMVWIFGAAVIIRMCNWVQNDTYRAAGDAVTGTVLELSFMYVMVLPAMYTAAYVIKAPFLWIFSMCYIDEIIRFVIMQVHMYSGRWVRPVTPEGQRALPAFCRNHPKAAERLKNPFRKARG